MRRWAIPVGGVLAVGLALTTAAVLPDVLAREAVAVRSAGAVVSTEGSAEPEGSDREHGDGAPREHERLRAPRVPTEVTPLVYVAPDTELVATAYHLDAPIYARRDREPDVLGHLRRGRALPGDHRVSDELLAAKGFVVLGHCTIGVDAPTKAPVMEAGIHVIVHAPRLIGVTEVK